MTRILSQKGNIIVADFGKLRLKTIGLDFKTDILYADDYIALSRISYLLNGKLIGRQHVMTDLSTTTESV